jgi:hypothetical protein
MWETPEVEPVRLAGGAELDHRVVGTDPVAVVARGAVAAREAAACLVERGGLVQAAHDLVEGRLPARELELRLDGARRVRVVGEKVIRMCSYAPHDPVALFVPERAS